RFNRPVQQIQLLEPPEAALKIAALNQPLDCIDRAVLTAHPNKDGRIVSPLLGQLDTLADEGFQRRTGCPFGSHPGSIPQRTARRDPGSRISNRDTTEYSVVSQFEFSCHGVASGLPLSTT